MIRFGGVVKEARTSSSIGPIGEAAASTWRRQGRLNVESFSLGFVFGVGVHCRGQCRRRMELCSDSLYLAVLLSSRQPGCNSSG